MKYLLLALLLSPLAHAEENRFVDCNKKSSAVKIQRAMMRELVNFSKEYSPDRTMHSFRFTPVVRRGEDKLEASVFLESTIGTISATRSEYADFTIDAKTCAPDLRKYGPMMDQHDFHTPFTNAHPCQGEALVALRESVKENLRGFLSETMPGSVTDHFIFSDVTPVRGSAGDLVVVSESLRPGVLGVPVITHYSVDPQTCTAKYVSSTVFNRDYTN